MISIRKRPQVGKRPNLSIRHRPTPKRPSISLRKKAPQNESAPAPLVEKPEQTETTEASKPQAPALSLSSLNSAQSAAMAALPAPAAGAMALVWEALDGSRASQSQFLGLLEAGTLGMSDGQRTVVESLRDLTTEPRAQGYDGAEMTRQTVALLADPDLEVCQGKTFTCGATNVQRQLADSPATLARLVEDLSDREGTARFDSGFQFQTNPGSVHWDESDRNQTNRLLQGALMSLAGSSAHGAYSAPDDRFSDGSMGLQLLDIASLTGAVEGNEHGVLIHDGHSTKAVRKMIAELPEGETFQTAMGWNGRDHMLLVTGHQDGEIQYFSAAPGEARTGSMPVHDFLYKTQAIVLSKEQLNSLELPPEAEVYWEDSSQ